MLVQVWLDYSLPVQFHSIKISLHRQSGFLPFTPIPSGRISTNQQAEVEVVKDDIDLLL